MKELTNKLWPIAKILLVPYFIFLFLLTYRIDYQILAPGGISEVQSIIEIDYLVNESKGSISSTYVVSMKRPTLFQFIINDFSKYNSIYFLPKSTSHYSDEENRQISYLQKTTSVDAAVIIAYKLAAQKDSKIIIDESAYHGIVLVSSKAKELTNYDKIPLGSEFISMLGEDGILITDIYDLRDAMLTNKDYLFTFAFENKSFDVNLQKEDIIKPNIGLSTYYLVDEDNIFPKYTEAKSNIGGPSGGLLQTLSIYNMLTQDDITRGLKIAGTGTIEYDGSVGYIGGMKQKIATAYFNKVDLFFVPDIRPEYATHNYTEALAACVEFGINPEGWLIPVGTIEEAIAYLEGIEVND